jgi:hypothetical protein
MSALITTTSARLDRMLLVINVRFVMIVSFELIHGRLIAFAPCFVFRDRKCSI